MVGQTANQDQLFYAFNLEDHIPCGHLLRGVNRFLDLGSLCDHLAPFYSDTGRPSIDPELMRMLVIGYCFGIRSERRLCEEVRLNLAYRWFCQLGLEDKIPDHSTFSKNRHGRFRESETFRHVFESVLRRCISEGLVGGEGFAGDASVIKADANRANVTTPEVPKPWPVEMHPVELCVTTSRRWMRTTRFHAQTATPRVVSSSDPQSRYTAAPGGPAVFAYSTNYLIDPDAGIIMDVEATPAHRTQEVESTKTMVQRVEERFDIKPNCLVGDTAYGTSPMLNWMVNEKQIEPHVRVWDRTQRTDDTLSSGEFVWDEKANEYRCPQGLPLKSNWRPFMNPLTHITQADTIAYRASSKDCGVCPQKSMCCHNTPHRKVTRSIYEGARETARKIAETDAFKRSGRQRKKAEMLFAHLIRVLKLDRLRLRGLCGAQDEFLLAATAQNLRRMAKWLNASE